MSQLMARPKKVYLVTAVTIVLMFALSAVGHSGTDAQNDASSVGWIGSIGWVGFLLALLFVIVYTVVLVAHRVLRRQPA